MYYYLVLLIRAERLRMRIRRSTAYIGFEGLVAQEFLNDKGQIFSGCFRTFARQVDHN